jgi:glutamate-ammonia-ligase adenylyltransferase
LAFRRVSDELGATPWYLRLLRDESVVAERMAKLLSTSKFFTDLLLRTPESVSILADESELIPRSKETLLNEMHSIAKRQDSAAAAVTAIRGVRQRELIRLSAGVLTGNTDVLQVGAGLSDLTDATVQVALDAITSAHFWDREPSLKLACIGLGRWGGRELNFGSDADAMFVYEALFDRAATDAVAIVSQLQQLLAQPAIDPPLELDLDLRPEGKQGAIARSLDSYQKYYERWSLTWESQALLRARFVAGDSEVADKLLMQIDSMRYPSAGLSELELREIRRIKARVESERLPRGADPAMHVKLGPGGIADVEWSVQLLQLQHAGGMAELRSPTTTVALDFAVEKGLLSSDQAMQLMTAWMYASRIRNTNLLATGKENDSIPNNPADLRMLTYLMGEPNGAELIDNYRRFSRRSRKIMEDIVYGDSPK